MENSQKLQEIQLNGLVETATHVVEILSRVFKLNIYYPEGHTLLDDTVAKFIAVLHEIDPSKKIVQIKFDQHICRVESQVVDKGSAASRELHKLFTNLGIRHIDIDKNVQPGHLIQFVQKLLSWRIESEAANTFANFDTKSLPKTIRIQQQEFIVGLDADFSEAEEVEDDTSITDICKKLSEQGLCKEEVNQCRELLDMLSRPSQRKTIEDATFPSATWQDVQALLVRAFSNKDKRGKVGEKGDKQSDVNALSSIFESLGRGLEDEKSKAAMQLLLRYLKEESAIDPTDVAKSRSKTAQSGRKRPEYQKPLDMTLLSLEQVNQYIYENTIPQKIQKNLTKVDRSEELSINFQIFMKVEEESLQEQLRENIATICQAPLTEREKLVLFGGLAALAERSGTERLFELLVLIVPFFRKHGENRSLLLLLELHDKIKKSQKSSLWPLLVNEILVIGCGEKPEIFIEISKRASGLHFTAMQSMVDHLETLDALSKGNIAPEVFRSDYIFSYPLFCLLLDTSQGKVIAEKILSQLISNPKDKLISAVGPLLDLGVEPHEDFFKNYLMQAHHEEPPLVLRMEAGQIIVEFLQGKVDEPKEDERLVEIIVSSVDYHCRQTKEILERIINDKKLGMLYVWPKHCRKAAWTALKTLERKKL